jgi:hypothetical protein
LWLDQNIEKWLKTGGFPAAFGCFGRENGGIFAGVAGFQGRNGVFQE